MRHFSRNSQSDIFKFKNWYSLARGISYSNFKLYFRHEPTTEFGRQLFQMGKRSSAHVLWPNHPPQDFYLCQITLSDTEPVGFACRVVNEKVEYVSVMIVAYTKERYLDTNNMTCCFTNPEGAQCTYWFPLLKNLETWAHSGFMWYVNNYTRNMIHLTAIIDWLCIQTSEPYVHMRVDLMQAYLILFGSVKPRWS